MGKRELILDSVKKLIALGVSDDEIVSNLADVGVEKNEALELTKEARQGASSFSAPKIDEYVPVQSRTKQKQITVPNSSAKIESSVLQEDGSKDVFDEITAQLEAAQQNVVQAEQASFPKSKNSNISAAKVSDEIEDDGIEPSEIDTGMSFAEEEKPETEESIDAQANSLNEEVDLAKKVQSNAGIAQENKNNSEMDSRSESLNALRRLSKPQKQTEDTGSGKAEKVSPLFSAEKDFESEEVGPSAAESEALIVNKIISAVASENSKKIIPSKAQEAKAQEKPAPPVIQKMQKEIARALPQKKSASLESVSDSDIEELWKKGIVVAMNAKLAEMKKLKMDVDYVVQQKVDSAVRKETDKFKVLLDSQKELIISSNKEALEEKLREIAFIIDSKIAELRQYNVDLKSNLSMLEKTKGERDSALSQLSSAIEEVRRTKGEMISETNSELIRIKSQTQEFIDSADAHLKEMDDRIAKTLELEKNIAEGMLQEAEQRIDELAMQKAQGLLEEMEVELNKIRAAEKQLSLDTLKQKIEILDEFKKQFLKNMEDSIAKINGSVKLLDQKSADAERQLNERMLIFDAKIEGLEKFEKEFADYIQELLSKK
ncbi:MAG: hypothetical protein WC308_01740 [archaeon]|jgi:hypothetical protein